MRYDRHIGLLVAGLCILTAACGDVDTTGFLTIEKLSAFSIEKDTCTVSEEVVPAYAYDAQYGVLTGADFLAGVWLRNSLTANDDKSTAGESQGRTNTNRIQVERFVLSFPERDAWPFLPESIEIPAPVVLDSGERSGHFERLLPVSLAKEMLENPASPIRGDGAEAPLRVILSAEGHLLDGDNVESNEIEFILSIGNGAIGGGCPLGYKAVGCSVAQPDAYGCEEDEGAE